MAIRSIITRGYGSGGSIAGVVTRGYTSIVLPVSSATPAINFSGKVALDLAVPGDIEDPATNRAILFLHDAVELLSQDAKTVLNEMDDIEIMLPLLGDQVLQYNRTDRMWRNRQVTQLNAGYILFGNVDSFTPSNVVGEKLKNYSSKLTYGTGGLLNINDVDGEITIPATGIYTVKAWLTGTQGSITIEQMFILQLNIDAAQLVLDVLGISTSDIPLNISNKTAVRSLGAVITHSFVAGTVLSLSLGATANMGVFTTVGSSFEVVKVD